MRFRMSASLRLAAALCMLVSTTACLGTAGDGEAPPNRIIAQNLDIEEGRAVRFGIAPSEPFAHVLVTFAPESAGLMLCPLTSVDGEIPSPARCRVDVGSGVRETVTTAGLQGVAIVATRGHLDADVTVEFEGPTRAISAVLPEIVAPDASCDDEVSCSLLIEVTPFRDGRLEARASWDGPRAELLLLQGRILARSARATGLPYRTVSRSAGAAPLSVDGRLSRSGEYALILRQLAGAASLRDVRIDAAWP